MSGAILIIVSVLLLLGFGIGGPSCEAGKRQARQESERVAVETGHAEYYLNEKHERAFRWKPLDGGAK